MSVSADSESATTGRSVAELLVGWRAVVFTAVLVGFVSGCWVGYVLVYPVSSVPLPKYTLAATVLLGVYVDYFADSMLRRIGIVIAASVVAYATAFVWYAFPALLGWYPSVATQRAMYFSGLRESFIFTLLAMTLLFTGTFVAYILRNVYAEVTR